jgi:hypothetical protein
MRWECDGGYGGGIFLAKRVIRNVFSGFCRTTHYLLLTYKSELMKMKTIGMLATLLVLASCVVDDGMPNFEKMTESELAAYNQGRNIEQMIVCSEDTTTTSRVRRRRCATVLAMYGTAAQAEQLGVLSSGVGFSDN